MNRYEPMGRGPYRKRLMDELTDGDLECVRAWAHAELEGLRSGDGRCEYRRYQDLKWSEVRAHEYHYWEWAARDYIETLQQIEVIFKERTDERERLRQERERLALAEGSGEPLFTPKEQREIEEHDLLGVIEDCYTEGRKKLVKLHHPDKGGDPKIVLGLNLSEAVATKLFAEMRKQLKGES